MKVTVGRVVYFNPNGDPHFSILEQVDGQPLRADVCCVNADDSVNLVVNDCIGRQMTAINTTFLQPDEVVNQGTAYAYWMPYQIEAAKEQKKA